MLPSVFTDRQKSILAAAVTTISIVIMVAVVLWLASLILSFFSYFSGVFLPLAVAAILATLIRPYFTWLDARLKNNALALIVVFLSVILPLVFLISYFGRMLLGEITALLNELPVWVERAQLAIEEKLPLIKSFVAQYSLKEKLRAFLEGRVDLLTSSAAAISQGVLQTGSVVFSSIAGLLGWLVLPIYFAFLIQAPRMEKKDIEQYLPFLKPETRGDAVYLITEFVSILVAFFRGQLIIAMCQGLMFSIGFTIVGLPHGAILGLILGMLNIVPYLGNMIGLAVLIPLAYFHPTGGTSLLASVAVVFACVQMTESYFLTPRIMGKTTGLHPMMIIFAILFWGTALNGLLGMILAIPLTAFMVVLWRLMKSRYIKEWL